VHTSCIRFNNISYDVVIYVTCSTNHGCILYVAKLIIKYMCNRKNSNLASLCFVCKRNML
jgi:hypothetical protein